MKEISLTKGQKCIVDTKNYERLSQHKWHYLGAGYAVRSVGGRRNKKMVYMHRLIMDVPLCKNLS